MSAKTTTRRDQPTGSAHDLNESAAEFETFAEKAADKFRDVADEAEQFAGRAAEQGRDAAEKVQEVAGNFKVAVNKSLNDQPMTTLAMAAALGLVLGALWKK